MPPNTLFRRDTKQAVNMSTGSNAAEPQTKQTLSEPVAQPVAPSNIQKLPHPQHNPAKRKAANTLLAKSLRVKAILAQPGKAAGQVPTQAPASAPAPAPSPAPAPTPVPSLAIWGHDSAVKKRIDQLKIRNAQLAEQLQRLPSSAKA